MAERSFAPVGAAILCVATPMAYWGFQLVRDVVEAIVGRTLHLHVASLAELREGFARREGASVVMTCDLPDADLGRFLCGAGLPLIVISDDVDVFLDWTRLSRGMSPEVAARFCSRMYASLAPNVAAQRKLLLSVGRDFSPERLVADTVAFLWPGRDERLAGQTFKHLADCGKIAPPGPHQAPPAADARAVEIARAAVAGYAPLAEGREPEEIVWPLPLFHRPDDRPWGDPIDLTGPARVVLFGPYMHLPAGDWTARVEFEIDGAVSGVEAAADVRINEVVTEKAFVMPAKGIFAYELSFRVEDPHQAVEIRLFMKKSAIEGRFLPRSVRVTPRRRG
jgi:hypothetical protein